MQRGEKEGRSQGGKERGEGREGGRQSSKGRMERGGKGGRVREAWEGGRVARYGGRVERERREWRYAGEAAAAVNTITSGGAVGGAGNKSHSREPLTRRAAARQLQPIYGRRVIALRPYLDLKPQFSRFYPSFFFG